MLLEDLEKFDKICIIPYKEIEFNIITNLI